MSQGGGWAKHDAFICTVDGLQLLNVCRGDEYGVMKVLQLHLHTWETQGESAYIDGLV